MNDEIELAVKALSKADAKNLYANLGAYSIAFVDDAAKFSHPAVSVSVDVSVAGPLDDAVDLGKRILRRWSNTIYELVCGGADIDPEARKTILSALKVNSPEALAAAITGVLISAFSVAPAIAVVVGVLFGKVLFPAAGQEACTFWKERL